MYEEFYKLDGAPFRINPDPRFFFASRGHKRALAYLRYGLQRKEGFIVITGSPGTGKTTLARTLLDDPANERVVVAHLNNTLLEAEDVLRMVSACFGLEHEGLPKASLLHRLESFFMRRLRAGEHVLLLIDEAQNLPASALEELRMLSNFHMGNRALLQIFLLGQQQFRDRLNQADLEQLRQRVVAACHLEPLNPTETRSYIEHRLRHVGWTGDPEITPRAFARIYAYSRGVPRRINAFCDRLLLYGSLEELHTLDNDAVEAAFAELSAEISFDLGKEPDDVPETVEAPEPEDTVVDFEVDDGVPADDLGEHAEPDDGVEEGDVPEEPVYDAERAEPYIAEDEALVLDDPAVDDTPMSPMEPSRPPVANAGGRRWVSAALGIAVVLLVAGVLLYPYARDFASSGLQRGSDVSQSYSGTIESRGGDQGFVITEEPRREKPLAEARDLPEVEIGGPSEPEPAPEVDRSPEPPAPAGEELFALEDQPAPVPEVAPSSTPEPPAEPARTASAKAEEAPPIPSPPATKAEEPARAEQQQSETPEAATGRENIARVEPKTAAPTPPAKPAVKPEAGVKIPVNDLQRLVGRFVRAYEQGKIEDFMGLFSATAYTNDQVDVNGIRSDYAALFKQTKARKMEIRDMKWERQADSAKGEGRFYVAVRRPGEDFFSKVFSGTIILQVAAEEGTPLISGVYHVYDKK